MAVRRRGVLLRGEMRGRADCGRLELRTDRGYLGPSPQPRVGPYQVLYLSADRSDAAFGNVVLGRDRFGDRRAHPPGEPLVYAGPGLEPTADRRHDRVAGD